MNGRAPKKASDWLTPQNMLIAATMAWGAYGSFVGFQKDTSVSVARLTAQMEAVERRLEGTERNADWLRDKVGQCR